jgi:hypothetical protein
MKLAIPVFTVVAVILVAQAPDVSAQTDGRPPAFSNGPSDAAFSGFIEDKPVREKEIQPFEANYEGRVEDKPVADQAIKPFQSSFSSFVGGGSQGVKGLSGVKQRFVDRVHGSDATLKGHQPAKGQAHSKTGSKHGYGQAERSWLYDPWVSFEYMNAWIGERQLPPLVSTSPPGSEGVIPGAEMLFGGGTGGDAQDAGRLTIGAWLDCDRKMGLVGRFFATDSETIDFSENSDSAGSPLLARPFYETWDGAVGGTGPASYLVSGVRNVNNLEITLQGNINAHSETEILGADAYVRYMLHCNRGRRVDLIAGYQFSRVDDSLSIHHVTHADPGVFGARFEARDDFEATNKFHGGQIGLLGELDRGPLTLSVLGKVGLGNMNEVVTISGQSQITDVAGGEFNSDSGILALPSNIGTYKKDRFAVIPELEAKATWRLTNHLDFSIGYTIMYWDNVAMAGDQIETNRNGLPIVNSSQWFGGPLDGPANPTLPEIVDTDLFLHALNLGLTFRL